MRLPRTDPRHRAGATIVALVYLLGYTIGRAGGRADEAAKLVTTLLDRDAARPSGT